jgi:hypothetical protein
MGESMKDLAAVFLQQIDGLVATYEDLRKRTQYPDDFADIGNDDARGFVTAGMDAIQRIAGVNSQYATQLEDAVKKLSPYYITSAIPHVGGALKALRQSVASGYLVSAEELIHADLFSDFLEMAEHLQREGYKDPAAVIIGGVLEEQLRNLCVKNGIPVDFIDSKGDVKPKKAETMNTDLAAASVYSKGDQKNVTAWYDLRTKAAHGHYNEYTQQQVELLLQSVRDFITRHPA